MYNPAELPLCIAPLLVGCTKNVRCKDTLWPIFVSSSCLLVSLLIKSQSSSPNLSKTGERNFKNLHTLEFALVLDGLLLTSKIQSCLQKK